MDFQMDYNFSESSSLTGLSLLLQVSNLTNEKTTNYKTPGNVDVPDPTQLVPNYTYEFGRTLLFGAELQVLTLAAR